MLLAAELIIVCVLIGALLVMVIEEDKIRKSKVPRGALEEYWEGRERRKSIRITSSFIVRYTIEEKAHTKLNCRTKDISSTGMGLIVNEKLATGTMLLLEFILPETQKLFKAEGKVAWATGEFDERNELGKRLFHMGIEFINIGQDDRNELVSYIEKIAESK
ncbi:MAG: PilZ domain-containing protein [Candidatus Omnitrophica bacterium]|nr:PilZ domain-containing protein [Candidatus Omnitrophota bacterium]